MPGVRGLILLLVILALGAWVLGFTAINANSGPWVDINDEQFSADGGEIISLKYSNIEDTKYSEQSEIVVTDTEGVIIPQPGNYTWFRNNGTILVNATGTLATNNNALIDYRYAILTSEVLVIQDIILLIVDSSRWLLLAVGAILLITTLRVIR